MTVGSSTSNTLASFLHHLVPSEHSVPAVNRVDNAEIFTS